MKFTIRPTIAEESLESWVWTNDDNITTKGFIIIEANGKKVKTFKRTLDQNFEKIYNDKNTTNKIDLKDGKKYLLINEYYRDILLIGKQQEIELEISKANFLQKLFLIHWSHPNPTVQFANRATVFSVILGVIALGFAIWSICLTLKPLGQCVCHS